MVLFFVFIPNVQLRCRAGAFHDYYSGRSAHPAKVPGVTVTNGMELADKPGSVVDNHSSRQRVAALLKQPTR